mmetsp:Transcript_13707/g.31623  ORF Transcript_13707/g.31623 Transcript_13707/m.31623 type:complete len:86 (+) Transcript_13707:1601-1858(+)
MSLNRVAGGCGSTAGWGEMTGACAASGSEAWSDQVSVAGASSSASSCSAGATGAALVGQGQRVAVVAGAAVTRGTVAAAGCWSLY